MSAASDQRAAEFLAIADQFRLGALVTEASHPVTADLSEVARASVEEALDRLFEVDDDVVARYRRWVEEGATRPVAEALLGALRAGGRVFFTGCGSTGRLSILLESIWRRFWRDAADRGLADATRAAELGDRAFSAMAGGDFALIKSVEGFEDFTQFGRRQIADLGIGAGDILFAITEGGETSWVIGTAWEALDRGAGVYFVYNNPDDILVEHVERSREVIQEPRITRLNLTTGPMAITGSTRMQATTIQLCVLLTVLETAVRQLLEPGDADIERIPEIFLEGLEEALAALRSPGLRASLANLVRLEEAVYRSGRRNTYLADVLGVDMLTDTTERSPTFCTPPFRRCDDTSAAESWAFLRVPHSPTAEAWQTLLGREPRCVSWSEEIVRAMTPPETADRTVDIVRRIGVADLMKFTIGLDGAPYRPLGPEDIVVALVGPDEGPLLAEDGFVRTALQDHRAMGGRTGLIVCRSSDSAAGELPIGGWTPDVVVELPISRNGMLLDGIVRASVKMLLNALSTCTMVRLGRVMGNTMIWVVASNLKLIDRATRYIVRLTDLPYDDACRLLFDSVEYVTPRMAADQAYPPVVGLSVIRARRGVGPEEAERLLWAEIGVQTPAT